LLYRVFGVTPHTSHLAPLLSGLAILFVVWRALPREAALPGLICALTCMPLASHTLELFPDLVSAAFAALAILLVAERLEPSGSRARWAVRGALAASAWFMAMLAKETAWWALPVWAGALLVDAFRKRGAVLKWFHAPALLCACLLTGAYLWGCSHYFGDPWARFHAIQALSGRHAWSMRNEQRLVARLTMGVLTFLWREYGPLLALLLPGAIVLPARLRIWSFYAVFTVLAYWFGSASVSSYQPLPLMARMTLPSVPGMCICGGYFLYWLAERVSRFLPKLRPAYGAAILSALLLALMSPRVLDEVRSWRVYEDLAAMRVLKAELAQHPQSHHLIVTAEKRTTTFVDWSFGYAPPSNVTVRYAGALSAEDLDEADAALILIDPRNRDPNRSPSYERELRALHQPALFEAGNVALIRVGDLGLLQDLPPPAQRRRRRPKH